MFLLKLFDDGKSVLFDRGVVFYENEIGVFAFGKIEKGFGG